MCATITFVRLQTRTELVDWQSNKMAGSYFVYLGQKTQDLGWQVLWAGLLVAVPVDRL
jgi:hypothetical protein